VFTEFGVFRAFSVTIAESLRARKSFPQLLDERTQIKSGEKLYPLLLARERATVR